MKIELSLSQQSTLLQWARRHVLAETDEACEPAGYDLVIRFGGTESFAVARYGPEELLVGAVDVELTD